MKKIIFISALFLACISGYSGKIKNFLLDTSRPITIKVAANHGGTTTIMFPGPIAALNGTDITKDNSKPAAFFIMGEKGASFFSVDSQRANSRGNLNVVYNHKIYVLDLVTSTSEDSYSSVTFKSADEAIGSSTAMNSSPGVLKDLIKKAQMYPVLSLQDPGYYEQMLYSRKNQVFKYAKYDVLLKDVYRFKAYDALIFNMVIKNNTSDSLVYNPRLIAVRTGSHSPFFGNLVIADGKIPPHGAAPVWMAVCGTPDGDKNWLLPDNDWTVLLTASRINQKVNTLDLNKKIVARENELKSELSEISSRLNSDTISDREVNELSKKINNIKTQLQQLKSTESLSQV